MKANLLSLLVTLALGRWTHATDAAVWPAFDASALENGQTAVIPNWELGPFSIRSINTSWLSVAGNQDDNVWLRVPISRCTLVGCLIAAGVPPWDDLSTVFFSDNLRRYTQSALSKDTFPSRVLYRRNFTLSPGKDRHFFLETHGITPWAEIDLNGQRIADVHTQAGSFGGRTYDITSVIQDVNALLITAFPTSYAYNFAQSFVDWNPYPPDNGTGIWRNISLKQTGPVFLSPMSVQTEFTHPSLSWANLTFRTTARNLEDRTVTVDVAASLFDTSSLQTLFNTTQQVEIPPRSSVELTITQPVSSPPIWWPRRWGKQPLARAQLNATVDGALSDSHSSMVGIREITSRLNKHGDLTFLVNRQPFQVLGAGYAPDLFLRWDSDRFEKICEYVLDIGLNTIRLEGKMEQPELYDITDRLGIMVLPGWECCDKWEAWSYNDELAIDPFPTWTPHDYATAGRNMEHEALMLQTHPSVLGFMVGSDFSPDDKATANYVDALQKAGWQTPIIAAGSQREPYPALLGPSGMKMLGPYDWVPPNYWWDTKPASKRLGAAFGFGSELGAGVGTPELGSLLKFLAPDEVEALWQSPHALSYHNGQGDTFSTRTLYNDALAARYGAPTGSADYLRKAQMMDYEATRAQFEAYSAHKWDSTITTTTDKRRRRRRPATGMIYWMLNNAWPSLHWNLFDYYLRAAGSYFGAKTGSRLEHVAYDYEHKAIYLINHSLSPSPPPPPLQQEEEEGTQGEQQTQQRRSNRRTVRVEAIHMDGTSLLNQTVEDLETEPNTSQVVAAVSRSKLRALLGAKLQGDTAAVVFLRLELLAPAENKDKNKNKKEEAEPRLLSRNVYWLTKHTDTLRWADSTWYHTPVEKYAAYTALDRLPRANVTATARRMTVPESNPCHDNDNDNDDDDDDVGNNLPPITMSRRNAVHVTLTNQSPVPAVFIRLNLVKERCCQMSQLQAQTWEDVVPVKWEDNYVTLWPYETMVLVARPMTDVEATYVQVDGKNVDTPEFVEIIV